jgi:hypothetical protein
MKTLQLLVPIIESEIGAIAMPEFSEESVAQAKQAVVDQLRLLYNKTNRK